MFPARGYLSLRSFTVAYMARQLPSCKDCYQCSSLHFKSFVSTFGTQYSTSTQCAPWSILVSDTHAIGEVLSMQSSPRKLFLRQWHLRSDFSQHEMIIIIAGGVHDGEAAESCRNFPFTTHDESIVRVFNSYLWNAINLHCGTSWSKYSCFVKSLRPCIHHLVELFPRQ